MLNQSCHESAVGESNKELFQDAIDEVTTIDQITIEEVTTNYLLTTYEVVTGLEQISADELTDKTVDEITVEVKYTGFDLRLIVTASKTKEPNEKILTCNISFLITSFLLRGTKIISKVHHNIS